MQAKDAKTSPLQFSQRFLCYIEKHRIFELFQELSAMLLINKPDDHLIFLKQSIYHAARRLDAPRIIILAPPEFEVMKLASDMEHKLDIPLITMNDIAADSDLDSTNEPEFYRIVENLRLLLMNFMSNNRDGWILVDFPKNDEEARHLQRNGIIPTHVIEIISSNIEINEAHKQSKDLTESIIYNRRIRGLRQVFAKLLKSIDSSGKGQERILDECLKIVKHRNYIPIQSKFRLVLIDYSNLERSKSLGQYIAETFKIIHIEIDRVLESYSLQDTKLGEAIRSEREYMGCGCMAPVHKVKAFEEFVFQSKAVTTGWVLTGFPLNLADFKQLDMTDTPPNRVIIILPANHDLLDKSCDLQNHNSNSTEVGFNCKRKNEYISDDDIREIIAYCGESAALIKDDEDMKVLKDKLAYHLMQPPACAPPRKTRSPPLIDETQIEYDPDDEPNPDIFAHIRAPEPKLPIL